MEIDRGQFLHDDRVSDCQSFGGNYHPSSQSRKISIGITIDPLAKKGPGATRDNKGLLQNANEANTNKESSVDSKNKGKAVIDANEASSPWVTTKSFNPRSPTSETELHAKETSNFPGSSRRWNKPRMVKDASLTHAVQFFSNEMPILHSGDGKKKFNGITYKRKGGKDGNSQRVEEFKFATMREDLVTNKAVVEDKTEDRRTESLRMRLHEILETVSSPKSQPPDSQAREIGANNLKPKPKLNQKCEAVVRPRQNSDTIETDSESPDHTIKRPVTCSLARKRASTKVQQEKTKAGLSSSYRQKLQQNIFSFERGLFGKADIAVKCGSSMSRRKKEQRMISSMEPRKICFKDSKNADEIQGATQRCDTSLPAKKTSSLSNKPRNFGCCPPQTNKGDFEQNLNQEKHLHLSAGADSHQSLGTHRTYEHQGFNSPAVPEKGDQQQDLANPSLKNVVDPQDDLQSPTFKINTPILSSSPCSAPKTDQIKQVVCSPALAERRFTVGNVCTFRTWRTANADYFALNPQMESSDDGAELKDSPPSKLSPLEANDVEDGFSESSSEDGDSGSSEESLPIIKGHRERDIFSPETATAERSKIMLNPAKRLHAHKGSGDDISSQNAPCPKGIGESDWIPEPPVKNQEDELERVIMLFALALENFKNKVKSATRKKTSEILMSVSEDIHLQLENIESQIQTELGKLTSISKTKRKHLETRLLEQQEQLKAIHDKFKQDIHQHLQDFKRTLEGLEVHQIELKGTLKKQKASHQKLFMQVEEAVETRLNDAQRRITAVHKLAKGKMLQLRHVITECLNEDG